MVIENFAKLPKHKDFLWSLKSLCPKIPEEFLGFSKRTQRTSSLIHSTLKKLKSLKHQEFLQLNPQELSVLDGHQDVEHLEVLGVLKNQRFLTERNLAVLDAANFAKRFIQTSLYKSLISCNYYKFND